MLYFTQAARDSKGRLVESFREEWRSTGDRIEYHFDRFIGSIVDHIPDLIAAIVVLVIGLWLVRKISKVAERAMLKRELEVGLRTFLRSLISIGLKIILIVTVAGMVGIGTASFVTILGAAGLAIGLALQGSLSNFAGGVLILTFKPFKVGDTIESGGQTGEVTEIQIFNTILLTGDHKTVILPNGPLSNGTIVNFTRYGDLRLDLAFTLSTGNDLEKIKAVAYDVMKRNPRILDQPAPGVFITKMSDNAITINVRPFVPPALSGDLTNELYTELKKEFEKNNFRPAIQERIIHTLQR